MDKITLEISVGEALDKYSILELKKKHITDEVAQQEIQKEMATLNIHLKGYIETFNFYYKILVYINGKIWTMMGSINTMSVDNEGYAKLSHRIFEYNQIRFRIKNIFNLLTQSSLKEQKSYSKSHCLMILDSPNDLAANLYKIYYLSIHYDVLSFNIPVDTTSLQPKIPTIIAGCYGGVLKTIHLVTFNTGLNEIEKKELFTPRPLGPIVYVSSGLMGDFIHSLSVICEKWRNTGRKGILYITEKPEPFRLGLKLAYEDTRQFVSLQPYIQEYKIHGGEPFDIDLSTWRQLPNLYYQNFYESYKEAYRLEWGKTQWLTLPPNSKWRNIILINTVNYRWAKFDYAAFIRAQKYPVVFVSTDPKHHQFFEKTTGIKITFYCPSTFYEFAEMIQSCKLFVGIPSAPLAIAFACHKECIVTMPDVWEIQNLMGGIDARFPFIKYHKKSVLFINHGVKNCGVYQYGLRLYQILKKARRTQFVYCEVADEKEYVALIQNRFDCILYNYHSSTMLWLTENNIQRAIPNIAILHETESPLFDARININPLFHDTDTEFAIPRPIYENWEGDEDDELAQTSPEVNKEIEEFIAYGRDGDLPIFGSFGFGFKNKGFDKLVKLVNREYDEAIIKLVIPAAHFSFADMYVEQNYLESLNVKAGVQLKVIRHFFTNKQILRFLASNTMNIFLYDKMDGRGISSAVDYALSVKVPFGISDSAMFANIYDDSICLYKTTVKKCIENFKPYNIYSHSSMCEKMDTIIEKCTANALSYSYSFQDVFVITALNNKRDGCFLEIGSHHPITNNNSFLLENRYGWRGLMVEYADFSALYEKHRPRSTYVIQDARTVNYRERFEANQFPENMDYLQIDLDADNKSTLDTLILLNDTLFDKYKFATVTFEHDYYRGDFHDTRAESRRIFAERGYTLVFPDVSTTYLGETNLKYEDWYVHPELVDAAFIAEFKTDCALMDTEIKRRLLAYV